MDRGYLDDSGHIQNTCRDAVMICSELSVNATNWQTIMYPLESLHFAPEKWWLVHDPFAYFQGQAVCFREGTRSKGPPSTIGFSSWTERPTSQPVLVSYIYWRLVADAWKELQTGVQRVFPSPNRYQNMLSQKFTSVHVHSRNYVDVNLKSLCNIIWTIICHENLKVIAYDYPKPLSLNSWKYPVEWIQEIQVARRMACNALRILEKKKLKN